ncbi:beta-microseminoprotein-like [Hyla sarda]|uniref:beta-microseminoprotein-like n=1 Tax=Hyla sarda TaxID=327740 RepID=UPI0024C38024|nr:beta-microseminoprotein-like [Hyla sarda]
MQGRGSEKCVAVLILCAGIFATLCNAACSISGPPKLKEGEELKGCLHKGKLYEHGTTWRGEDCLDCSCDSNGIKRCCTNFERPVNYDPERCVFIFNKETCKYELIPNEDPEKQCLSYSSVG